MQKFLSEAINKYYLSFGEHHFSPITQVSASQIIYYTKKIQESKNENNVPFIINFPNKCFFSLWVTLLLELNILFEEQYTDEVQYLSPIPNKKINLFGAIGKYLRLDNNNPNHWLIEFSDQTLPVSIEKNKKFLKIADDSRKLNSRDHYLKKRKEFFANRNSISKILSPKSDEIFNSNNCNSTVLLITGRGQTNKYREKLNEIEIYGEKLSKTFLLDKNLIIKPDLEDYLNVYNDTYETKYNVFIYWLNRLINSTEYEDLKSLLNELKELSNTSDDFIHLFESITLEFQTYEPRLNRLIEIFPGKKTITEFKYKAVIINDSSLYNRYKETINSFLEHNVPIVFITERKAYSIKDLNLHSKLVADYPTIYSLTWSNAKMNSINSHEWLNLIDVEDYKNIVLFFKKSININCTNHTHLDLVFHKLIHSLKDINEINFNKYCYKYLYPILFHIRCSNRISVFILSLIEKFSKVFEANKNIVPSNVKNNVDDFLRLIKTHELNVKSIPLNNSEIYSYSAIIDNTIFITPSFSSKARNLNDNNRKVIFPGFPQNEFKDKPIVKSVFELNKKDIEIICWPYEGHQTYNYLKSRIANGVITDNIPHCTGIDEASLLNSDIKILHEINSNLKFNHLDDELKSEVSTIENDYLYVRNSNFSDFTVDPSNFNLKPTECYILHFENNRFLFLPKNNTKKLFGVDGKNGQTYIKGIKFDEVSIGNLFLDIDYSVGLKDLLILSGSSQSDASNLVTKLGNWKKAITAFFNSNKKNIDDSISSLEKIKKNNQVLLIESNPTQANLSYWLDDTEKIALSLPNLLLIAKASEIIEFPFTLEEAEETYKLRNKVRGKLNSLNASIKRHLQKKLNESTSKILSTYNYEQNNVKIKVEILTVIDIDSSDNFYVDYSKTRKVLC